MNVINIVTVTVNVTECDSDCDFVCSVKVKHFGNSNITLGSQLKPEKPDAGKGKTNTRDSEVCVSVCLMAVDGLCVSQRGRKEKMQRMTSKKI